MATNAEIVSALPPLIWDGLLAPPYALVSFGHENALAERRVPYVDNAIHDDTGLMIAPMTARLMFLNTVEGGTTAGVRNFPEYWNEWNARLDGTAHDLQHPIYGPMRARVKGARGELVSTTRSGVVVEVTWVKTVEDPAALDVPLRQRNAMLLAAGSAAAGRPLSPQPENLGPAAEVGRGMLVRQGAGQYLPGRRGCWTQRLCSAACRRGCLPRLYSPLPPVCLQGNVTAQDGAHPFLERAGGAAAAAGAAAATAAREGAAASAGGRRPVARAAVSRPPAGPPMSAPGRSQARIPQHDVRRVVQ